jgi:hypothetical protein
MVLGDRMTFLTDSLNLSTPRKPEGWFTHSLPLIFQSRLSSKYRDLLQRKAGGRPELIRGQKGRRGKRTLCRGLLLPTPETKKFGKTDDYRLLNQNILFQSNVKKTWEHNSPLPSIFCLLNSTLWRHDADFDLAHGLALTDNSRDLWPIEQGIKDFPASSWVKVKHLQESTNRHLTRSPRSFLQILPAT